MPSDSDGVPAGSEVSIQAAAGDRLGGKEALVGWLGGRWLVTAVSQTQVTWASSLQPGGGRGLPESLMNINVRRKVKKLICLIL